MSENLPKSETTSMLDGAEVAPVETAKEKFERERLSRRQALKRLGITSAMATFALFSVDDLARMVGKAMQQRAADNKIVEQIAKEFQESGVAFADTYSCYGCTDICIPNDDYDCEDCGGPCLAVGKGRRRKPNPCGPHGECCVVWGKLIKQSLKQREDCKSSGRTEADCSQEFTHNVDTVQKVLQSCLQADKCTKTPKCSTDGIPL